MLSTTRLALLAAALFFCSVEAKACFCINPPLPQFYESTAIVFIAKVGARSEIYPGTAKRKYLWTFEISELFKGEITFDALEAPGAGSMCPAALIEGHEYLIFTDPRGRVDGCIHPQPIDRPKNQAWVAVLRAFASGEIPSLTEPWFYSESPTGCTLTHRIVNGDGWLRFKYSFSHVDLFNLRVKFPEQQYIIEGTGRLLIGDMVWTTRPKPNKVSLSGTPEQIIEAEQAYEVLAALEFGTSIRLQASLADDPYSSSYRHRRFPNYPLLEAGTPSPFLGDAPEKFRNCLDPGNL